MSATGRTLVSLVLATALGPAATARAQGDDFQTWYTVSTVWPVPDHLSLISSAHFRLTDDSRDFTLYRLGQAVIVDPVHWLRAGVAYRYGERKNSSDTFVSQQRFEAQATPQLRLGERAQLSLRNRLELRWTQGTPGMNERLRNRFLVRIATPQWRRVRALFFSNETFYDFDQGDISENRFVPAGVSLYLHERASLRLNYTLRSIRSQPAWRHDTVIGTGLTLRF